MSKLSVIDSIRRWLAIISTTLAASIFWGFLAAILGMKLIGLSEDDSLVFIGIPVALTIGIWLGPKAAKITGWD